MDVPDSIVEACKRGDPDAFEELIRLTNASVYSLSLRIVGNPEDAAEVTQDVYIRLLKVIKQFRGDAKFSTWLHRVTTNVAITLLRKRSRRKDDSHMEPEDWSAIPALESSDPAVSVEQAELRLRLETAVASLPEDYRTVVVMKDIYGMSFAEIGEQLGVQEGTARVRLFRARKKLKSMLQDEIVG